LHSESTVRWKVNYENSGSFVAAHFLAAHNINSCLHPSGVPFFSFEKSVILYNPEGIIHEVPTGNPILGPADLPIIGKNRCSAKWVNNTEEPKIVTMKQSKGLRLHLTENWALN
jgi:hypothetical protein